MTTPAADFIFSSPSCLSPLSPLILPLSQPSLFTSHLIIFPVIISAPFSSPLLPFCHSFLLSHFYSCCDHFTSSRTDTILSRIRRKLTTHTINVISVQERGQPVGSGAGKIQPGEWIHAGRSNGRAGGLCHDAGGGAATLLQRSHWAVQNRCQPFALAFVSLTDMKINWKAT